MATARQIEKPHQGLYQQDFLAWTEEQAKALRTRQIAALDWDNLLEKVTSMGFSLGLRLPSALRLPLRSIGP